MSPMMMTAEQERIKRLGKVRALLEAASLLIETANREIPTSRPIEQDREVILDLHVRINAAREAIGEAIKQCDQATPL